MKHTSAGSHRGRGYAAPRRLSLRPATAARARTRPKRPAVEPPKPSGKEREDQARPHTAVPGLDAIIEGFMQARTKSTCHAPPQRSA